MREQIRDKERLLHILQAINIILSSKDRYNVDSLNDDPIVFYGFVKQIEIIGEAVYMLSKAFREENPNVEWDDIERMRHVLVHGYYRIKPSQVWATIQHDIPLIKPKIEQLLSELE